MAPVHGNTADDTPDGLRAAIGRARRPYLWAPPTFVALAAFLPVLIAVFLPAVAGSAIGLTERVPAVVQSVQAERRADNPDKKVPWSVAVSWTDADGVTRQASENVSATQPPYQVGEQVDVGVLGDNVTLRPASETAWMLAVFAGWAAVCLAIGFLYWRRSRVWVSLPETVSGGRPDRSVVVAEGRPLRRRPHRHLPLETGLLLPIRGPGTPTGAVFVLDRAAATSSGSQMPQAGDQLEIWDGSRVSAVHRPADGSWWVTGVDTRDIDVEARGEHRLSASAKRLVIPLVLVGALAVAAGRWLVRDDAGPIGWGLLAAGFALVIVALVVMSRDRRRSKDKNRRSHPSTQSGPARRTGVG